MALTMRNAGQHTEEPRGRHKLDEQALSAFLSRTLTDFRGGLSVRKFGYGQSNPTYFLEADGGQRLVLRKQPPGKLIKGAHAVDREFRVMRALGEAGFEVPKVHLLCEDVAVLGSSFYVMDFVKGRILDNGLENARVEERRGIMLSIVDSLARLHSYDPSKLGLVGKGSPFGRVGGFYVRQMATMERTSAAQVSGAGSQVPPMRNFAELLDLFRANMPEDRSSIIHGDWKPDNLILSEGEPPRVLAVLDWELSTIGHPMSDLANMCFGYYVPRENEMGWPVFDTRPGSGVPSEEEVHKAYCEAAGVPFPIDDWSFYLSFACLRLAVIIQGVAMRTARGQASAHATSCTDLVHTLVGAAQKMCDLGFETMQSAYGRRAAATSSKL